MENPPFTISCIYIYIQLCNIAYIYMIYIYMYVIYIYIYIFDIYIYTYMESTFSPQLKLGFQTTTKPGCEPRQGPKILSTIGKHMYIYIYMYIYI